MYSFLLFFALFGPLISTEEDRGEDINFIAHGNFEDKYDLAKYIVSLQIRKLSEKKFGFGHFCAGIIIGPQKILTAAHCLVDNESAQKLDPSDILVVAGLRNRFRRTKGTTTNRVLSLVPHPNYSTTKFSVDVGYIHLRDKLKLDNKTTAVINMSDRSPFVGEYCTLLGWGRLFHSGPMPSQLSFLEMKIADKEYCLSKFRILFTSEMICAWDPINKGSACNGDSGGPLICNGMVSGIVSWGMGCTTRYMPNGFTDISSFKSWIDAGVSTLNPEVVLVVMLTSIAWVL